MTTTAQPFLFLPNLYENKSFLPKATENLQLVSSQLLITCKETLLQVSVYNNGDIYILWWTIKSLSRLIYREDVQGGSFSLNIKIKEATSSSNFLYLMAGTLELLVIRVSDIMDGNPCIYEIKKLVNSPQIFLTHAVHDILLIEENYELKLIRTKTDDKDWSEAFNSSLIEKYNNKSQYFLSKKNAVLYSLGYSEQVASVDVHYKLIAQDGSESKEIHFYSLTEYDLTKPEAPEKRVICSIICGKEIIASDINTTEEQIVIMQANGYIFIIQNINQRGSKIFYGKPKQMDNTFQLKWLDNLPVICCYGRDVFFLVDCQFNLLKSFREKTSPLASVFFLNSLASSVLEDTTMISYLKADNQIVIKCLSAQIEDGDSISSHKVFEELINFFFETGRLQLAVSLVKEKSKFDQEQHSNCELQLVALFEQNYSKVVSEVQTIIDYFIERFKTIQNAKKFNFLVHRVILTLLSENNIEAAYRLAKGTEHVTGFIKIRNYCNDKTFSHLEEKMDEQLNKIIKKKYGLDDKTLKDLRYLKDITSIQELAPFDTKLNTVLESLGLSYKDISERISYLSDKK